MAEKMKKSTLKFVLFFLIFFSGGMQIFIGSLIGPMSVNAEMIPMTSAFNPERTKDQMIVRQLNSFSRKWKIVSWSGASFLVCGFAVLVLDGLLERSRLKQK